MSAAAAVTATAAAVSAAMARMVASTVTAGTAAVPRAASASPQKRKKEALIAEAMDAISGQIRMPHVIDTTKCIHCDACWGACPFGAIDAIEEEV